jgi:hypothetical protein
VKQKTAIPNNAADMTEGEIREHLDFLPDPDPKVDETYDMGLRNRNKDELTATSDVDTYDIY